eukprot:5860343-Pleurochrysis_carterae.AAC.1
MPTSQQIPGCGDKAWNWKLGWRLSRENGIQTLQPCRVDGHLVMVSQGRGNDTEGSRLRRIMHH